MIVYGLTAKGVCLNFAASISSIASKKLFRTEEEAMAYKEEFIKKCIDPDKLDSLHPDKIKVYLTEFILED